jgi:hypothetical protein
MRAATRIQSDRNAVAGREAPRPADAVLSGPRRLSPSAMLALQRRAGNRATVKSLKLARQVEIRGVPWEPESGLPRRPELIDRLNAISPSLIFSLDGDQLKYEQVEGITPSSFDRQMIALIDRPERVPMRLVNRQALLGDPAHGFHDPVDGDAFQSGYVDIDDLLAGDDLGFQMLLVHFLTERAVTGNYARRIGTNFTQAEFDRGHSRGIEAEAQILREFFGDPTIEIWEDSPSVMIRRVFRNHRGDRIRRRIRIGHGADQGVNASWVDVVTHDRRVLTPEGYLELLQNERAAAAGAAGH